MTMNIYQLKRLCEEILPRIIPGRVEKIYQPENSRLEIALYAQKKKNYLTLRTAHGLASCYLTGERTGSGGEAAPDFCMKLRKHLQGLILERLEQVENDRIIRFGFAGREGKLSRTIVAELFSAAGNCFLLDEQSTVLAVLNPVAARGRGNFPGSPYRAPEPVKAEAPPKEDTLEKLILERNLPDYNSAVRDYYEELAGTRRLQEEKQRILKVLTREHKRLSRLLTTHEKTISLGRKADWHRECGEILSAHFRSLRRGQEIIHLPDLYVNDKLAMREIPLDPALSPLGNVERYFKKYKKLKKGTEFAIAHLVGIERKLKMLEGLKERVEGAASVEEAGMLAKEGGITAAPPQSAGQAGASGARLPYRRFQAADGSLILVGKGGKDNDELTFRIAKGRDLWLHVSGAAGSHVVLSCPNEGVYTEGALLDAAHLAVFYSKLKKEPFADVDYTYRKHLNKPKGLPPGKVFMSSRKTIHLKVDRVRLARLLKRESVNLV
ncbi:MAG TPA: NFACT family protein [archaeon]|nr:NFACT family protein [archaeon]